MRYQRRGLKEAAVRMTWGKLVAERTGPASKRMPRPAPETPWSDSDHHLYPGTPRRGIGGDTSPSCEIFSAKLSCAIRPSTLARIGAFASQNAKDSLGGADPPSHENGGSDENTSAGARTRRRRTKTPIVVFCVEWWREYMEHEEEEEEEE